MYKLIEFIRRIYVVLLFLLIEGVALYAYAHSTYYTQAKILAHTNSVIGGLQNSIFGVKHYFTLRSENEMLAQRVAELETQVEFMREQQATSADSLAYEQMDSLTAQGLVQYRHMAARIISNTTNRERNFITLNKGTMHGVIPNMGVITPDGVMVGFVAACSNRYSVVKSILNTDFRSSGKIVGDDRIGSISWSGKSPYRVEMNNLSIYAEIEVGDEVISSGVSQYFPPDMKVRIGYVESYQRNDSQTANDVVIRLATDLAKVSNVILIENYDYNEVTELENAVQNGTYSTGGAVTPY